MHYGWVIVVVGTLCIFACLGLGRFALGMLLPSMATSLNLSYAEMGFISTGNFVGYLVSVLVCGFWALRIGARKLIFLALLLIGCTMILSGMAQGFRSLLVIYTLTGIGSGAANVPVMALVTEWFTSSVRGRASGFVVIGSGFAIILSGKLIPFINELYGAEGWRIGWYILGSMVIIIAFLAYILLRDRPEEKGLKPIGGDVLITAHPRAHNGTDRSIYKKGILYHLGSIYFLFGYTYVIYATFIVTSRERLHLSGEEIFPTEPLPLGKEAIELFAARAKAQRPEFEVNDANRGEVAEVVRLLDGLPLAIELAAARVGMLTPAQLVERMRNRFQLLAGVRGPVARRATLRAAIDWSWDLLAPWEQAALAQCSVFEGGFTLHAAEAVLDLSVWSEAPATMDIVQALLDKSLLRLWMGNDQRRYDIDEPHFGMYVSIHEYARARLGEPARGAAQARHGRFFAGFGSDEAIAALLHHRGIKRRRALAVG